MLERLPALVVSRSYKLLVKALALFLLTLGAACLYCYLVSGVSALLLTAFFDVAVAAVLIASLSLIGRIEEYRHLLRMRRTSHPPDYH